MQYKISIGFIIGLIILVRYQDEQAEGKICPQTLEVLAAGVPCNFGSKALFTNEEARQAAEKSYHKYEWSSLHLIQAAGLSPASKLAFRIVTTIGPQNVNKIVNVIKNTLAANGASLVVTEGDSDVAQNSEENDNIVRRAINLLSLCKNSNDLSSVHSSFKVEYYPISFVMTQSV